ncbi:MAG: 23S rRNA (adenine(2503)-C(2))-methyltransferase RlmN, partial [Dehalococcoidia bacterium]|nr:23S rRNA (adenine(2503)-C(2))-methyltransferase RlmN [Dehalococcoidia bacterium]
GSFDEMTDLPKSLRERLAGKARLSSLAPIEEVLSSDRLTTRGLFQLQDGKTIESVLMLYEKTPRGQERHTVCVSTQVGCAIGCAFCATGQQGLERNLSAGEIVDQVVYFARKMRQAGVTSDVQTVTNVVLMGMGEPLANYEATMQAVRLLNSPQAFGLGARHITISTAGLVPGIRKLSKEDLQVGLAISLHAADDELRDRLVPVNKRYPVSSVVSAAREYFDKTRRRPTFEYVLLNGTNDSPARAAQLARLIGSMNCNVNLIPANPTGPGGFKPPARERMLEFQQVLTRHNIQFTLRQSRGDDIQAGCGQLRSRFLRKSR